MDPSHISLLSVVKCNEYTQLPNKPTTQNVLQKSKLKIGWSLDGHYRLNGQSRSLSGENNRCFQHIQIITLFIDVYI